MVTHEVVVRGVRLNGVRKDRPVLLQMHDDDFPARFLQDLASVGEAPLLSSATEVNPIAQPLFQPVQRMVALALADVSCLTPGFPRVDPARVESAGLVIRRVYRSASAANNADQSSGVSAWIRLPNGQFRWMLLNSQGEDQDPDPAKRPMLQSGQLELDRKIAALRSMTANAESYTPAFIAPPDTCAALERTVVYAVIPTASAEVSDARRPTPPLSYDSQALLESLPALLRSSQGIPAPVAPLPGTQVDYRWLSDDYLRQHLSTSGIAQFQMFSTSLRMLYSVFGAFDGKPEGQRILQLLNTRSVHYSTGSISSLGMGDFFTAARTALLDYNAYPSDSSSAPSPPSITMPSSWDSFTDQDQSELLNAMQSALGVQATKMITPQGRFQDSSRQYRLRMFFRIKGETPACPAELVWSNYSEPFRIAAWYESSERPHPPVPLPDPTKDFMKNAKPNCSFLVPKGLMGALQGTSMSGLMDGGGGGPALKLDWICGFNIPLITICAFFVLNIFLMLLNIVFFWLPFIKICVPFPMPSSASGDSD
jgi:hypothetical protein